MKFLYLVVFGVIVIKADPLLVVSIMVKDEEAVIKDTLEPFLKADPSGQKIGYFVFDTGSTDNTIQNVQTLFKSYPLITFYIVQEPFIDFATSRNRALDLTENYFPNTYFVLMPDAEWYISNVEGLLEFCQKEINNTYLGPYFIHIKDAKLNFFTPRLIRQSLHSRFKGVVHEALVVYAEQLPYTQIPSNIFFTYNPAPKGIERSRNRYFRDRDLLIKEYEKNPQDTQTTFYLAQTYECLEDWNNAYYYYCKRCQLQGWQEENFFAAYKRAVTADKLMRAGQMFCWQQVHDLYLQAFESRPCRIEPLIKIAQYYLENKNMALALLYAKATLDIPYPTQETSFVEKSMYNFDRYTIIGTAAWYTGNYELGRWGLLKALEVCPQNQNLLQNLKCYSQIESR